MALLAKNIEGDDYFSLKRFMAKVWCLYSRPLGMSTECSGCDHNKRSLKALKCAGKFTIMKIFEHHVG